MAGAIERVFVAPPIPTGGGKVIAAPFQFYTSGEDNLRVVSVNSLVGVSLKIQARLVDSKGVLTAASWDHTPNSDRSTKSTVLPLSPGAVLNLTVFANAGTPKVGQTFVIVQLIRGLGAAAIVLGTLLQGYVTSTQALAWPGSPCISSTDGEPAVREIGGSLPAPGANVAETVPTGARWQMMTLFAQLVTSAVVGNRQPWLILDSPVDIFGVSLNGAVVPASTTAFVVYGSNQQVVGGAPGGVITAPIPSPNILQAGQRFRTFTPGIDAGDQYQQPIYTVREWLEVN